MCKIGTSCDGSVLMNLITDEVAQWVIARAHNAPISSLSPWGTEVVGFVRTLSDTSTLVLYIG